MKKQNLSTNVSTNIPTVNSTAIFYPRVFLKKHEEREIEMGFPWVFDNEIDFIKSKENESIAAPQKKFSVDDAPVEDGALVELFSASGKFLGTGVINSNSKITVRIISRTERAEEISMDIRSFITKRVRDAVNIRRLHYADDESCRLIFGEADSMPGLIVEKFVDTKKRVFLVVQFLALAAEVFRDEIIFALKKSIEKNCDLTGIYERSDADIREKEGLPEKSGWLTVGGGGEHTSKDTQIVIEENGVKIIVDIANGQKTGYFLDQKDNRRIAASYCRGKRVLDACAHTGSFALHAALNGAASVTAVEISSDACDTIAKNAELNNVSDKIDVVCADVFDYLKKCDAECNTGINKGHAGNAGKSDNTGGKKFDVIILDPPAFAKNAKAIQKAYGGYKEINLRAMRILTEGGILITCSCSAFFDAQIFYDMLTHAAHDAHKNVQVLAKRGAGCDHPVMLGYPRSEYLKCAILRVM